MLKRKLKRVGLFVGGILLASGLLGWGLVSWINGNAEEYEETHPDPQEAVQDYALADMQASAVEENGSFTDDYVLEQIHGMSHQKVQATDKWYNVQLTEASVQALSDQVDAHKDELAYYDTYREILDKWLAGNFKTADDDHNTVWELQGGNIGKATGTLSKAEEAEFVKEQFGE
jgi:hypothetical protein